MVFCSISRSFPDVFLRNYSSPLQTCSKRKKKIKRVKTREVRDGEEKGYILMCYLRALFCPSFLFLPRLVHRRIDKMASW